MAAANKRTFFFGNGKADGRGDQKTLLGGKGAGLAEMTRIGLPVPAGFTITTEVCKAFHEKGGKWPSGLDAEVRQMMAKLERACGKKFGSVKDPLLVSVRSGAARSMPGMMETILNLGLNDQTVEGLATVTGDRRFALDAYRRLITMYGSTAKGVERFLFEAALDAVKEGRTRSRLDKPGNERILDTEVNESELESLVSELKYIYEEHAHEPFPQDPIKQIRGAIDAVFESWMAEKAATYRRVENITGLDGTAVNVCQMVFGNLSEESGTGVCFTRDPNTGESVLYGDLLMNAQGEDVVAGIRTPLRVAELGELMPEVYDQLQAVRVMLELHYRDMQDLEFTIERGKLYMLQTRSGKRSPGAAFRIAVDQATKGMITNAEAKRLAKKKYLPAKYATLASKPLITKSDAVKRISAADIERLFYPVIDPAIPAALRESRKMGEGIGAVPGAACGIAVFSAADAEAHSAKGTKVVLIRKETSPEDVGGMYVAAGILTATGGKTSHAAVVARGWGKCCIVGCEDLDISYEQQRVLVNGKIIRAGEWVTLDGSTGSVYEGSLDLVQPEASAEYDTLMRWCDEFRRLKVRANADTPEDATRAVEFGAEGIGLCRTEHMFFDPSQGQRLVIMREMILARDEASRRVALEKILPYQREDFEGIFEAMDGRPVTIRLIDPPLHEFLPHADNEGGLRAVAAAMNAPIREELNSVPHWDYDRKRELEGRCISLDELRRRVDALHETNPMLGHRGCRLCITYPEILEIQVRAIIEAAANCLDRGIKVQPEIMIPLSIDPKELSILIDQTRAIADGILKERKRKLKYLVGTMIETPRAAITAEGMAKVAEFFSFGTNDLTQLTLGISRDDSGRFLPDYVDEDKAAVFAADPFQSIDVVGVGSLVRLTCINGRAVRKDLKLGVCGEHGGDPTSVRFFEQIGLDYVSCSPPRVPIARLAAAQAAIDLGGSRSRVKSKGPLSANPVWDILLGSSTGKRGVTRAVTKGKKMLVPSR
ncbi:MAG: putative PEP-binding protein [Planctomycetota bacterium]